MEKISRWKPQYKIVYLVFLFILAFFLRIYCLDQDLPAWGISNYQPMDEGQYVTMALNQYNNGSFTATTLENGSEFLTEEHIKTNFIGNIITCASLYIFGDNYYGLRMPSVIFGMLILLEIYLILSRIDTIDEKLKIIILTMLALDFGFVISSRVVETSIYRLFFTLLIFLIFIFPKKDEHDAKKWRFFLMGLVATISVFLIYITNVFVMGAIMVLIVYYGFLNGKKSGFQAFLCFAAGITAGLVLSQLYYGFVWHTDIISNCLQIVKDFSGTVGYTSASGLVTAIKACAHYWSSNANFYNLAVLFVFLMFLPLNIKLIIKEKNTKMLFALALILCFQLQTFITDDYILRKQIITYPFELLLAGYALTHLKTAPLKSKRFVWRILYISMCFLLTVGIVVYRLKIAVSQLYLDYSTAQKIILISQLLFVLIAAIVSVIYLLKGNKKLVRILEYTMLICSLCVSSYFIVDTVLINKTYTERDLMIELGDIVGDDYLYGVFSMSFTLYNDVKPVVNNYDVLEKYIRQEDNKTIFFIDYSSFAPSKGFGIKSKIQGKEYVLDRNFSSFGIKKSASLYVLDAQSGSADVINP